MSKEKTFPKDHKTYDERVAALEAQGISEDEALRIVNSEDSNHLSNALESAKKAFWNSVAKSYSHILTGDLPIDTMINLDLAMCDAIELWVEFNTPRP